MAEAVAIYSSEFDGAAVIRAGLVCMHALRLHAGGRAGGFGGAIVKGAMKHHYRLIYYSDTPQGGEREPPLTPEQFVAQELGHIANTHVDAWFPSVTYGYRTMYRSKLPGVSADIRPAWHWNYR